MKLAAEMQTGSAQTGTSGGMTLSELQSVAAEIGIDPKTIGLAVSELDTSPKGRSRNKSDSVLIEQTLSGELSEEAWDELVTEVQRFTKKPGRTEMQGNSREWRGATDVHVITLCAITRKGRTKLKMLGDSSGVTAGFGVLGVVGGVFLTLAPVIAAKKHALPASPILILFLSALIAAVCAVATIGMIHIAQRKFGMQMEALAARLIGGIAETGATTEAHEFESISYAWDAFSR